MEPRRICIVQLGGIGDLLLVTPLFRALKDANPGNELHLVAGRHTVSLIPVTSVAEAVRSLLQEIGHQAE